MSKNYLPAEIINRRKQGFPLPLSRWMKEDFKNSIKKYLLSEKSKIKSLIDQKKLSDLIEKGSSESRFGQKIWMLLSLEMWLREWFPEEVNFSETN